MSSNNFNADIYSPRKVAILGAGRFGRLAVERLKKRFPEALLSITDSDSERVEKASRDFGIPGQVRDCVESVRETEDRDDLWLVPAVPIHMAFELAVGDLLRRAEVTRLSAPPEVDLLVPNPLRVPSGTVYASFSTFICPDVCSEPDEICTHTGRQRLGDLYEVPGGLDVPGYVTSMLRSWQLAPGVGGYLGKSLREFIAGIGSEPGAYLIATSCRCHGVIDALEWKTRQEPASS